MERRRYISWEKQRKVSRWEALWRDGVGWRAQQAFALERKVI